MGGGGEKQKYRKQTEISRKVQQVEMIDEISFKLTKKKKKKNTKPRTFK